MSEEEPKIEKTPEQQLIHLLKERGSEDPEAKGLLIAWTLEQEKQVEASADPEASIQFNLRRARLYFEAGFVDEALENFESARTQAWNEHRDELYEAITEEMDRVESLIKS